MRHVFRRLILLIFTLSTPACWAQATARPCSPDETPGPACLLANQSLRSLPNGPVYWHIDQFASAKDATASAIASSTVTEAFGKVWLFTLERKDWQAKEGRHLSVIGPLPLERADAYTADYVRSIFTPGMKAPLHVHSGPEAFYAISGDTCLETPDGMQLGRGPGNSLVIKGGPPMLLMAVGAETRRGFALILHDASKPPTTLIHDWQPQGLCVQKLAEVGGATER